VNRVETNLNSNNGTITVDGVGTDLFGNIYVTGSFFGSDNNLGNIALTNGNQFFAKFAPVSGISGIVKNSTGDNITDGMAFLYGHTRYQRAPVNDSTPLQPDGTFSFIDVPFGRYLVYAIPNNETAWLPTYYPAIGIWEDAEQIAINSATPVDGLQIIVNERDELQGTNGMVGQVEQIEQSDLQRRSYRIAAEPVRETAVVLAREKPKLDLEVVAVTYTNEDGNFVFNDVENGSYILYVDIPGLPNTDYYNVTIANNTFYSNLDYFVDEETVTKVNLNPASVDDSDLNAGSDVSFTLVPNPADTYIKVRISQPATWAQYTVYDVTGKSIIHNHMEQPKNTITIDTDWLPSGLYTLNLTIDHSVHTAKFIIK
jgi:hypothetical protein